MSANPPDERLERYRRKRSAERTPEPFGGEGKDRAGPHVFVVQKHAARRLHYDLRLEWRGVLWSWAVPEGPSLNPATKRLAVQVEEHPVEYADFEGVIPEDSYGAGEVILWDKGRWVPIEDPEVGLERGKLLFDLHGYKLRGRWTLVRMRPKGRKAAPDAGAPREWLLIKKPDAYAAREGERPFPQESVHSGLTVEEIGRTQPRSARLRQRLVALGAPQGVVAPKSGLLMLAETAERPFSDGASIFELKVDGFRLLAGKDGGTARLLYRGGQEATLAFPEIARAVAALPWSHVLFDGELVVLDDASRPSFARLQQRFQLSRRADVERAAVAEPASLFVFDVLAWEGFDLRPLPTRARKELLADARAAPGTGPLPRPRGRAG